VVSFNLAPSNPMRALYRVRRVATLIAIVTTLALIAAAATYAFGTDLVHGPSQDQQVGR
jgi:hypothetical protein